MTRFSESETKNLIIQQQARKMGRPLTMGEAEEAIRATLGEKDKKESKHHNRKTRIDGITFHSKKEGEFYRTQCDRLRAGEI